jgi:hypothetical protein
MSQVSETLLATPAGQVIGALISFKSEKSGRIRQGKIRGIHADGVRVVTATGDPFLLKWDDVINVIEPEGAKA